MSKQYSNRNWFYQPSKSGMKTRKIDFKTGHIYDYEYTRLDDIEMFIINCLAKLFFIFLAVVAIRMKMGW